MQSIVFVNHLQEIIEKLFVNEIVLTLKPINQLAQQTSIGADEKKKFSEIVFRSRENYAELNKNAEKKQILELLGFNELYEYSKLSEMITAFNNSQHYHAIWQTQAVFSQFQKFSSGLWNIVTFANALNKLIIEPKIGSVDKSEYVELEIVDYGSGYIRSDRLILLLTSLERLHEVITRISGEKQSELRIKYFDSGSDIIFAIQSGIKTVEILRWMFLAYWDKIKFMQFNNFNRKMDALKKGFEIMEIISEQERKTILSPDEAKQMQHEIFAEMDKLTGYGVKLKETDDDEKIDQHKLLSDLRDVKLLNHSPDSATQ